MNTETENKPLSHADLIKSITKEGEIHICAFVNEDGSTTHTLLMPGDKDDGNWDDAMTWAKELGGDLPNSVELILLYEKHKSEFKPEWYWSSEQHASSSSYAWYQLFSYGYQYNSFKNNELRARAVRRLVIQ